MDYWNEPRPPTLSMFGAVSTNGRFEVWVTSPNSDNKDDNQYRLHVKKWILNSTPQKEIEWPQGWIYLWPEPAIIAFSWNEAREKQLSLVKALESNLDSTYYIESPNSLSLIEEIEQEDRQWLARIYLHDDGRYEVKYFKLSYGRSMYYWAIVRDKTLTFANSLADAKRAAHDELRSLAVHPGGIRRGT